jgi:hypothetical protein
MSCFFFASLQIWSFIISVDDSFVSLFFKACCKEKLVWEVCELAKHNRSNYPSIGERSKTPSEIVHSDVCMGTVRYNLFVRGTLVCYFHQWIR